MQTMIVRQSHCLTPFAVIVLMIKKNKRGKKKPIILFVSWKVVEKKTSGHYV